MGDRSQTPGGETGGYVTSELSGGKTGNVQDLRGGETGSYRDLTDNDSSSQGKGIIGGLKDAVGGITGARFYYLHSPRRLTNLGWPGYPCCC